MTLEVSPYTHTCAHYEKEKPHIRRTYSLKPPHPQHPAISLIRRSFRSSWSADQGRLVEEAPTNAVPLYVSVPRGWRPRGRAPQLMCWFSDSRTLDCERDTQSRLEVHGEFRKWRCVDFEFGFFDAEGVFEVCALGFLVFVLGVFPDGFVEFVYRLTEICSWSSVVSWILKKSNNFIYIKVFVFNLYPAMVSVK